MRFFVLTIALLLMAFPALASAQDIASYEYTSCEPAEASLVEVIGAPCAEAEQVAAQVLAAPPAAAPSVLGAAGWSPLRARTTSGGDEHDLVATRSRAALRIRRRGPAPDLDGWAAGRELIFARGRLVGGRPAPRGSAVCTAAFLVRLAGGGFGGLSAAHCGGLRSDRTVHRRNVGLRRPPQPGIILGRVKRILTRSRPLDALVVPVPSRANRTTVPVVDRGVSRPPWTVAGLAQPTAGRAVCFSGRTSGIDRCGRMAGRRARRAERFLSALAGFVVRCTSIPADTGDSGGPVFTAPGSDGAVRAVGIVSIILVSTRQMCFTPLEPVLYGLGARLVAARG